MTNEQMKFPETWEEYEREYGFNDSEEVYTNNSRLIPSFRVKQWLDHLDQEPVSCEFIRCNGDSTTADIKASEQEPCNDTISKQEAYRQINKWMTNSDSDLHDKAEGRANG